MATLVCRQLTFGYDGSEQNIFDNLDLTLDTGWRCALVGRNGRGKTTLLKLLDGQLAPDRGAIDSAVTTRYYPHEPRNPSATAFEVAKDAIAPFRAWERQMEALLDAGGDAALARYGTLQERYQQAGGYEANAHLEAELTALGLTETLWRRPFAGLSGGEQTRTLLASLFAGANEFPLIDEPTNHLDRNGRSRLADYLRGKPGFLMVSHDRAFLDACIDHVVALNPDTVEVRRSSFSLWRSEYRTRMAAQAERNASLKKEIAALTETAQARRAGAAKREATKAAHTDKGFIGARAARQMKRALSAERRARDAAEDREATLVDVEKDRTLKLESAAAPARVLATATNLSIRLGDSALFAPISFQVEPGDRMAVSGPNGCGKTTLLNLLAGADLRIDGTLRVPAHVRITRAHQHPRWQRGSLQELLIAEGIDEGRFRQIMAVLGVRGATLERPIETLSHGQQKKLDLARSFLEPADLLLWDEPLNFIDIDAREQIGDVLLRDRPTLIFVEHDAAFVDAVATKAVTLEPS